MHETPAATLDMLAFIDASPTPFHCAAEAVRRVTEAGLTLLDPAEAWQLEPGHGYVVARHGAVVALRLGRRAAVDAGFRLIGAHTDSPNLRVKPLPDVRRAGYVQLGVEVYGGTLDYTWLDRDLGLAGRVLLAGDPLPSAVEERLICLRRPLLRVPSLAIHLNRAIREDGLKLNQQKHLPPVLALSESPSGDALRGLLAAELGVPGERILDWDLSLMDIVAPTVGGLHGEFVFAPRLDNQAMCHAALTALLAAERRGQADSTSVVCLYDHEEVGSGSATGAAGALVESILGRVAEVGGSGAAAADMARAAARSWHISADMAHAVHPSYDDLHEPQHQPRMNAGPVIKTNAKQSYATSGNTAARFEALCREAEVESQKFVNRTDLRCGSTIGPITATRLGIDTVDVGNAMLSMHSIREQAGAEDQPRMIEVMTRFLLS